MFLFQLQILVLSIITLSLLTKIDKNKIEMHTVYILSLPSLFIHCVVLIFSREIR
jgi:hypothetical protein